LSYLFFYQCPRSHYSLHSFPTRRSSDLLNAYNDPFLTPGCFPFVEAEQNSCLFFEAPRSGGHVGFVDLTRGSEPWSERRVVEFLDRKSTRLNSSHVAISYAVFCLKKKSV